MKLSQISVCALVMASGFASVADEEETLRKLEARWASALAKVDLPGVAIAIVRDDGLVYAHGFGRRGVRDANDFDGNSAVYIASITKVFTGAAIMALAENGDVKLDAPVKVYLPRFEIRDKDLSQSISVRDLLSHRYGLQNSILAFAEAYTGLWDDEYFFRELRETTARGEWSYSNLHFTLLGRIIQAVTGKRWQDYLQERFFEPLGMERTTAYVSKLDALDNVAEPLELKNDGWTSGSLRKSDNTMHAAGGLYTTALDLAEWIRLFLNHGQCDGKQILAATSVEEILTPQVESGTRFFRFTRDKMGLAWYLGGYKDQLLVHHFGSFIGFHAHASFIPERNLGVVVLANSSEASSMFIHQMAIDAYDALLNLPGEDQLADFLEDSARARAREARSRAESLLPEGPLDLSLPLEAYLGTYASERWGVLELRRDGESLAGNIGNLAFTLYPNEVDELIFSYPLGREMLTFQIGDEGTVDGISIASYGIYTLRYVRTSP